MSNKTVVCITTLNEEFSICKLVCRLKERGLSVIVSDGGSDDNTVEYAYKAGAVVLSSSTRLPIREALVKAFEYGLNAGYHRFVQMDAGGSHQCDDLANMLSKQNSAVVIGSRFTDGAYYSGGRRRYASRLASLMCNAVVPGAAITDWTSGFRVYPRSAVEEIVNLSTKTAMHSWQIETLYHLYRSDYQMIEVPIHYLAGRSSFNATIARDAVMVWMNIAKDYRS